MSSFAYSGVRNAIRERIQRLRPDAQRQWGRMSVHQMVCHLTDGYRAVAGERESKPVDNFISRSLVRYVALHTSIAWPKGVKTMAEVDQEKGGTKPVSWDEDIAELLRRIDAFEAKAGLAHPIFGPLNEKEWQVWAFRHADHHLRQFGL